MTTSDTEYPDRYRPENKTSDSPVLSQDDYGFSVDGIAIENKYAQDYVGFCRYRNMSGSAISDRITYLPDIISFLEKARKTTIFKATKSDVNTYIIYCIEDKKHREGTIQQILSNFGNFLAHIHEECNPPSRPVLTKSQIQDINLSEFNGIRPPLERKGLPRETVLQLIENAGKRYPQRDKLIIRIIYETGLRNSDLRGLKLNHFKYDKKILIIENSKGGYEGTESYRIPIRHNLARQIRHWVKIGRPALLKDNKSEYLFLTQFGKKFKSNGSINNIIDAATESIELDEEVLGTIHRDGKEIPISNATAHVLRHSITTHLDELGLDDDLLKLLLGNTDTLDTYRRGSNNTADYEKIREGINTL